MLCIDASIRPWNRSRERDKRPRLVRRAPFVEGRRQRITNLYFGKSSLFHCFRGEGFLPIHDQRDKGFDYQNKFSSLITHSKDALCY